MSFSAMLQTWLSVLTKPGEDIFREIQEGPNATLQSATIWIIIATLISAVLGVVSSVTNSFVFAQMGDNIELALADIDPIVAAQIRTSLELSLPNLASTFCVTLLVTPIAFFIGSVIYFAIAKLLGGLSDFERHTYVLAAISAPIMVVMAIVNIVPLLGACIGLLIWLYQLVLTYNAMKVSHNLGAGQAVLVTLSPFLIMTLFVCCIAMLIGGFVAAVSG